MRENERDFLVSILIDGTLTLMFILAAQAFTGPLGTILFAGYFLRRLQSRLDELFFRAAVSSR